MCDSKFYTHNKTPGKIMLTNFNTFHILRINLCVLCIESTQNELNNTVRACVHVVKPTDALFTFSLFRHYTATCFGLASCPSLGGTNVIRNRSYVLYVSVGCQMTVPFVAYIHCYILMMGY
jgi:hypothetical protein